MKLNQIQSKVIHHAFAGFDVQTLESRLLMSNDPLQVTLAKGVLTINGSKNDDAIVMVESRAAHLQQNLGTAASAAAKTADDSDGDLVSLKSKPKKKKKKSSDEDGLF